MGIVAKAYKPIIIDEAVIEASDIKRALDDIYDTFNSGLNSKNFIANLSVPSSQVSITSTSLFSGATLQAVVNEMRPRGYIDMHFMGRGTAGITIFPGSFDYKGQICRVNGRIDIEATNMTMLTGALTGAQSGIAITAPNVATLTASDFGFIQNGTISGTAQTARDEANNALYFTISGTERRALFCLEYISTFWNDGEFYDHPARGQHYFLSACEAQNVGFAFFDSTSADPATASSIRVSSVLRICDPSDRRYYYSFEGTYGSATGTEMTAWVYKPGASWDVYSYMDNWGALAAPGVESTFFNHTGVVVSTCYLYPSTSELKLAQYDSVSIRTFAVVVKRTNKFERRAY